MTYKLSNPIQLETVLLRYSYQTTEFSSAIRKLLIDTTPILGGDDIVVKESDGRLFTCIRQLEETRITLEDYERILNYMRTRYPVVVKGKITDKDWTEILAYFEGDRQKALNWVESFVRISKG